MKVIVVGTNHAGTTAVRTIRRLDPKAEVVTYDKNNNISFLGCGTALWVQGEFDKPNGLFYASPEILAKEGITVKMEHEVIGVDEKAKKVTVKDLKTGKVFEDSYDKLIMGMGSWPIIPPIKGIDLPGINIVKWFQHAQLIKAANDNPQVKKVVVCGAGYIGVEMVSAFHEKGKDVTLVDICDRIMPNYYDPEFTKEVEGAMTENGVHLKTGECVKEFVKSNSNVVTVVTDKGKYEADMVIWAVGFKPATEILKGKLDLDKNGAIIVNKFMQTSNPDIYGIGDCIEVYDNAKKQNAYIALATNAVRTGVIAAINVVTNNTLPSPGFQGSNAINVFGLSLASTGMTETVCKKMNVAYECKYLEDNDKPEFMRHYSRVQFKVVWDKASRRILGAQICSKVNHTEVMYMFSLAILKGVTIDELPLIDLFFLPHFNKPYNFITLLGLDVAGLNFFK